MTEFPKTPPRTPRTQRPPRKEEAPRIPSPPKTPKTPKATKPFSLVRMQTSREISEILALIEASKEMRVIEVKGPLTEEALRQYTRERVPIVFRGLASKWKCVEDWSKPGYLKRAAKIEAESCPHRKYRQFTAHSAEHGRLHLTDGKSKAVPVSMDEFLTHAEGNTQGLYLLGIHSVHSGGLSYCPVQSHADDKGASAPLVNDVPKDVDFLEWYAKLLAEQQSVNEPIRYDHQQFFLSKGYAFTDLHYDSYDNFYVAVSGTRRWTLGCPNASRWLVNSQGGKLKSGSNAIPHLGTFEEGSPARLYPFAYVDLLPGDVLFVPTCWWHLVESKAGKDGFSSAFNFFFSKPPDEVFGEFIAQLAETDSAVNALQKVCRSRIAEACLSKPVTIPVAEEAPLDLATWNQLLRVAATHQVDLAPLKGKWDTNSMEVAKEVEPLETAKESIKKETVETKETEKIDSTTKEHGAKTMKKEPIKKPPTKKLAPTASK